jgi:hypothetical protein
VRLINRGEKMSSIQEIQMTSVIITFAATAAVLVLAVYFALRRKLFLAVVSMACFLVLFNPTTAMSAELCKPIRPC